MPFPKDQKKPLSTSLNRLENKPAKKLGKTLAQKSVKKIVPKQKSKHKNCLSNTKNVLKDQLEAAKSNPSTFNKKAEKMCAEFGFKVLLEIPAQLIEKNTARNTLNNCTNGTAIAILCPDKNGYSLLFAVCQSSRKNIRVIDEKSVPERIAELVWSYATVLSFLPQKA